MTPACLDRLSRYCTIEERDIRRGMLIINCNIANIHGVGSSMKAKTKSPLKDKPLRYVAQSGDEGLDDLLHDKVLVYYLIACICAMFIFYSWFFYFKPIQKPPIFLSILFGIGFIFCAYKLYAHMKKVKNMKQGRDGERAVGQYLEEFRESGCRVFHDIKGDSFNVDHVVISDKGIYVVETKTYSKPASGSATINYDGQKILINGKETLTDIIVQVTAATLHIKKILKDSTGKVFEPFPVVLFPGWYVDGNGNRKGKLWVLEPKAFRKFLDKQDVKISEEDVKLASYHLSRHIRTSS